MMDNVGIAVKSEQFDDLSKPLSLDLIAVFNLMLEDLHDLLDKAEKENWKPEKIIKEMEDLI